MNEWDKELMRGPTVQQRCCVFCGRPATNQHHVVLRSHGGGDGPTVSVCGMGNASGCHRLVHQGRIHLRLSGDRWEYVRMLVPTSRNEVRAKEEELNWWPIFEEDFDVGF